MMDLPIGRIKQAEVEILPDEIHVKDFVYKQLLLGLSNNIRFGDYVAMIHTERDGKQIYKLMTIRSDYEFETLNRRMLLRNLRDVLKPYQHVVCDIGLLHEVDNQVLFGDRPISMALIDGEFHYKIETH